MRIHEKIPNHICIIMDGNRRWAKEHEISVVKGYEEGVKTLKKIINACVQRKINYLTVFAFSTDNWKRNKEEVDVLLNLCKVSFETIQDIRNQNIKVQFLGNRDNIPYSLKKALEKMENSTSDCDGMILAIAFNYGGKDEIVRAFNKIYQDKTKVNVTKDEIESYLYSGFLPEPEILIRTGGEKRNSGFLLWKASYSELFYMDKYWPDFTEDDLDNVIREYNMRERKMGK